MVVAMMRNLFSCTRSLLGTSQGKKFYSSADFCSDLSRVKSRFFCSTVYGGIPPASSLVDNGKLDRNSTGLENSNHKEFEISLPKNIFDLHQISPEEAKGAYGFPNLWRVNTSAEEIMRIYRQLVLIRRMEITCDGLYKAKAIRGFCHLYDGEEAVCVGMESALSKKDAVITAYRDHGNYVARNGSVHRVFAELLGKVTGCSKGKGGSMHLFDVPNNFFGGWGIVGATAPLGAGIALTQKYMKSLSWNSNQAHVVNFDHDSVTVAIYGDGAANQGQIYEAMNMAKIWNLPVIFAIENNHYGMGTSEKRASAQTTFYDRVKYIPGIKADGQDFFAVKQAFKFGKKHALEKGPMAIEFDTYRYHGHSMSDPGITYRKREEIQKIRQARDPIERIRLYAYELCLFSEKDFKMVDREIKGEVEAAVAQAKIDPSPDIREMWTDVYANGEGFVRTGPLKGEVNS